MAAGEGGGAAPAVISVGGQEWAAAGGPATIPLAAVEGILEEAERPEGGEVNVFGIRDGEDPGRCAGCGSEDTGGDRPHGGAGFGAIS